MFEFSELIRQIAILAVPVLLAITLHEVAHGYTAYLLGDPTARDAGRLTLNPIKHLDPIGAIALFIIKVGWAKPVPINAGYFKNPRKDIILVSVAGPVANFILAILFAFIFHLITTFVGPSSSGLSGLIQPVLYMMQAGVLVNLGLGIFNLLPVPPLDGSNILAGLLPLHLAEAFMRNSKYGLIILIILLVSGVVQKVIVPVIYFMASLLLPI